MDYKSSGVDIDAGNNAVDAIKPLVKSTHNANVLGNLGHFAGMVELPPGYKKPVLVSCTDGVGTKLKLAIEARKLDTVGIDLVAMCVNDLICCGAKPLFFLDYIATNKLYPKEIEDILGGIAGACKAVDCPLVGGEMAEMGDMYKVNDFDLAGFCVGVVEKEHLITGETIKAGMSIYGLASSGFHSNGYSLVRKALPQETWQQYNISIDDLLEPTTLYVNPILNLLDNQPVAGLAHITGGGLEENIQRILPKNLTPSIDWSSWNRPNVFQAVQKAGDISDAEMKRVFNLGIGFAIIAENLPKPFIKIGLIEE